MTQSQSKTKKSVVDRPGPSSHHQEEDLIGFGLNHLQHANGTASLGHSAGVVSNLKNKGKKFIDGIFNNSRSKHLETFPDYNPDRPDAVSRKPTGSMQRKQMSGVLHLSEGKHRTNGNGLRPASSNSSIDSRPPWK
ncbi:Oidioi.mRNA.OKI2018_I69.XSR.g16200.t1.cds [Oikopleura dioica]|uniref:Oidioi.mRNA.OKI2018_I69.XSR.g16200.t1.cds n=1 Tax=Oikopleura dioica TaxID=34765 RepID=A0ABN7SLN6_OIKDI|nr:Oidioi.mRNA.OKI2018_I69.XSR.g16200.t1.cds [Oikopleura dioica]